MSFAANAITHPVKTYSGFVNSIQMLSDLAKDNEWKTLSKILFPEVCELVNTWDSLSPKEKGEKSGYIIGKYGADILIPGAAAKAVAQGITGAKEFVVIAKNIQRTEELIVLEALAETGGRSGSFAETVYAWKTSESTLNTVGKYSKNITNLITSKKIGSSKKIIDSVIKETLETKGYYTSKYALTHNEALNAGLKFLGKEYKELEKPGTGIFRSSDGLRQFRIDSTSIAGKHSPDVPHFHLEVFEKGIKEPIVNNHILLMEP
jgi:hypothetical protein